MTNDFQAAAGYGPGVSAATALRFKRSRAGLWQQADDGR
jgi:hypothetical protein